MKLVVTGHDGKGGSIFAYAGAPPRQTSPGSFDLWSTQGAITVPDATDAMAPAKIGYFPKEGETAWKIVSVPGLAARAAMPAAGAMTMPEEIRAHFDAADPEMHTTDTIDYVLILAGTAELELDLGKKESVAAGDCVVQRGTRHAWRVTSQEPLVMAAVLFGAKRGR
ncbi:MAG: cupin domain-containing protein [Deltaproteobacteria bacterium]|nr:cupin domain-containing protein [Deltaproteobacteria bacterium]